MILFQNKSFLFIFLFVIERNLSANAKKKTNLYVFMLQMMRMKLFLIYFGIFAKLKTMKKENKKYFDLFID